MKQRWHYRAIHTAIQAVHGKAKHCERCATKKAKRYEWSNKDHRYRLNRKDWWQLCSKCHWSYDKKRFGKPVWNRGKVGRQKNHDVSGLNRGKPWNKGMKTKRMVQCICKIVFYPPKKTSQFCSKSCAMKGNQRAKLLSNRTENCGGQMTPSIKDEFEKAYAMAPMLGSRIKYARHMAKWMAERCALEASRHMPRQTYQCHCTNEIPIKIRQLAKELE